MPKLNRSRSQRIENDTILNYSSTFVLKEPKSIKPIESGDATYYPPRSQPSAMLESLLRKPDIDYDQNLTFAGAIDQIFEGLDQTNIDRIKNHAKWNQNVSNVGLPKEKCLKNLQILAAIIKKKKANSPESTKAIQEGVMSNVQDFLNDSGCYANLIARLESYRITNLQSLVMSNALYQYIMASGGILTHFHEQPAYYAQLPLKKSPINSRVNNNITVSERDHRDIPNHDVKYFDEYIDFMHKSMKSAASVVTPEEMKDFILKNLATKLGYQDVQDKQLKQPESDIKDFVDQYDKDFVKYNKNLDKTFEPKIPEYDQAIFGLIKDDAIEKFERNKSSFLKRQNLMNKKNRSPAEEKILTRLNIISEPLIQNFLSTDYLSDLVNDNLDLDADAKDELKAKIEKLNLKTIISEYSQYKISKTKPDIALICEQNDKRDLKDKAEKYISDREKFKVKQSEEKKEVLKNLAESGYLDDISSDQEKENGVINYIPSKKLLNRVFNFDQSSKDMNDYADAFIPTLNLFDKKSRDQQEENNRLLNDVNFQPPKKEMIGDREVRIVWIALDVSFISFILLCIGFLILVFSASPLAAYIVFGVGAISLAGTVFVGVKTFLKHRSNNRCNSRSKDIGDSLKNQIKEKFKSAKNLSHVVKNEEQWNNFIKVGPELQNEINEIKRLYNINIDDLYNHKLKYIRQNLINRFVINDMVNYKMRHPIQPNNKVPLDNLSPSVNYINEDSNLDFTGKDELVPKHETTLSHNIFEESDSHDDDSIYSKDIILPDIVVEDFDATKNPSSQRTIQSAKSSLRNNETVTNLNLNDAEKLPHEIKIPWNKNLYKRLAKNPQVKVQNYINNENLQSLVYQECGRKNTQAGMPRRSNTAQMSERIISGKLSEKHRFLITMYGDQKTPLLAQYRDLMPIPKKTELASDNPRSKGMIKR